MKKDHGMIFTETGKLTDGFYVLGTRYFPTHLLFSSNPVLFEAGLSCLGPLYVHETSRKPFFSPMCITITAALPGF
jgi:hypothetical protein